MRNRSPAPLLAYFRGRNVLISRLLLILPERLTNTIFDGAQAAPSGSGQYCQSVVAGVTRWVTASSPNNRRTVGFLCPDGKAAPLYPAVGILPLGDSFNENGYFLLRLGRPLLLGDQVRFLNHQILVKGLEGLLNFYHLRFRIHDG